MGFDQPDFQPDNLHPLGSSALNGADYLLNQAPEPVNLSSQKNSCFSDCLASAVSAKESKESSEPKLENMTVGGVLELDYRDLDFDAKLNAADDYKILEITHAPPNSYIRFANDPNDKTNFSFTLGSNAPHHFKPCLKSIETINKEYNVDREYNVDILARTYPDIQQNNAFMKHFTEEENGFKNFSKNDFPKDYFKRMSSMSEAQLSSEEKYLNASIQDTKNPYFRIYLADIMIMETFKQINDDINKGNFAADKQAILQKFDDANTMLKNAMGIASGPLQTMNQFPQQNVVTPLAPGEFWSNDFLNNSFLAFWGGAWDQALNRQTFITNCKGLVNANNQSTFKF